MMGNVCEKLGNGSHPNVTTIPPEPAPIGVGVVQVNEVHRVHGSPLILRCKIIDILRGHDPNFMPSPARGMLIHRPVTVVIARIVIVVGRMTGIIKVGRRTIDNRRVTGTTA